jgi:hypothetical protein
MKILKLMYLSLKNISKKWTMPTHNWSGAMNQFAIMFERRLSMAIFKETHLHRISNTFLPGSQ